MAQRGQMEASEAFELTEIEVWEQDLRDIEEAGETFCNLTQSLYIVRKQRRRSS